MENPVPVAEMKRNSHIAHGKLFTRSGRLPREWKLSRLSIEGSKERIDEVRWTDACFFT